MQSPTSRALAWLRKQGYTVAVVEKWLPFPKPHGTRQDLFGFADLLAIRSGSTYDRLVSERLSLLWNTLAVQATSGTNHSHRVAKIVDLPTAKLWLEACNGLWVVSFAKRGKRGERKLWQPRVTEITLGMFS